MRLMLEQERRHAEGLRQSMASGGGAGASTELCAAERRMAALQEQLDRLQSSKVIKNSLLGETLTVV